MLDETEGRRVQNAAKNTFGTSEKPVENISWGQVGFQAFEIDYRSGGWLACRVTQSVLLGEPTHRSLETSPRDVDGRPGRCMVGARRFGHGANRYAPAHSGRFPPP